MKLLALLSLLTALALATPYNWSATPCKLLARNATAHPPDGTLVVGILYSVQLPITLEARAPGGCAGLAANWLALFGSLPVQTVMSVCMAITQAHEAHELGRYNVSLVLVNDRDMASTSPLLSDKAKYPRFMRSCSSVALSSLAMVHMFSQYGITRVVGIGNNDSYGQGGLQKLVTYATRVTPPIGIADVVYYPVATTNPPAFYAPYLESARIMGMLQKPYAWVLGNSITTYPTLSSIALLYPLLAEAIANDTIIMGVSTAVEKSPVTDKYTAHMLEYLKEDHLLNPFWGMLEYDAGLAWVNAAKKIITAGQDPYNRSLFYSTLISLEYQGATGAISFDENGDRFSTNAIFRWVAGKDTLATIGNWSVGSGLVIDPHYVPALWRGTEVAAKIIPIRKDDVIDEEKLLQEVTIMKSLRHPNLLLFMCYANTSEALTIVTEFMPRGSLLDVLSDRAVPVSTALKLSILSDIASGMAYLHGSSPPVIHCDLKSSNILLSASMQAKVCDFGLTVIAHKHGSAATQSDDSVLGSLMWSAPEIISNGMFSTKSDVYAFGIMLWETVTRELPYRDMNPVLVSANVAERNLRPEVGPEFESVQPLRDLMEQCWDASPDARPEFAEILGTLGKTTHLLRDLIRSEKESSVDNIQQSTELWEWNAQLMKEALYQHHDAMRAALHRHNGYEVMTQGDAFMILFQAAIDALRFCADAQRALVKLNWNPQLLEFPSCGCIMNGEAVQFRGLRVRMGIHYGQPEANKKQADDVTTSMTSGEHYGTVAKGIDYIGPCVNKATRVASCGKGGQIVLSYAAAQEVQEVPEALAQLGKLHRVGAVQLRGIAQSEEIFDFEVAGLERTFEDVHLSSVSELPHVPDAVQDLYERFSQTTVPSWAIAAKDVETTKEVAERGNFGVVFKGVWRSQAVAVKKFFRQKVDTITMAEIEHQIKEIALLSDIRHPNVVLFLGACTEPHNMFVVTEWMDNGSLQQLLASSRQIDSQRGIAILTSTCSAMTYLHQCNIVHRDLKSSNILLSKSMDVKVSDFGMGAVKTANKISTLCGSIAWMAPEVLSSAAYTEASDVYSFGVVMNEILTGEVPFKDLNKVAVSRDVLQGKRPDIPKKLGAYTSQYVDLMCRTVSARQSLGKAWLGLETALAVTPYNWSSTPCAVLLQNTTHPPPNTLVVGVLHTGKSRGNLEIVMSVCMALSKAGVFGSYNASMILFDDLGLKSMSPVGAALFNRIPVVAVIGGDSSSVSMALLDGNATHPGLTASGIPLISSQSTSPALSDKAKYPRFIRVCTSSALSSLAMIQMFSKYGITKIAGIGNDDSYGHGALEKLQTYADRAVPPIEIADIVYYPAAFSSAPEFFRPYLEQMKNLSAAGAQAFVLYCAGLTCLPVLEQARVMGLLHKPYAWVLGNGITTYPTIYSIWKMIPQLSEVIANDSIVMGMATAVVKTPVTAELNAEMEEYMKQPLAVPAYTTFEYDAALALSLAVRKIAGEGRSPYNTSLLYSTLLGLEYTGSTGDISFDENGDRFATISIFRYVSGSNNLEVVGNWTVGSGVAIDPRYAPWAPAVSPGSGERSVVPQVVGGVVGSVALLAVAAAAAGALLWRQRRVQRDLLRKIESEKNTYLVDAAELVMGRELGQGSYGTVYQAQWRGTEVAAKVVPLRKDQVIDEEKLLQEVSIMRSLRHPSLLLFMCYAKTSEALTIVTEFMPRGSLLDVLSDRAVPLNTALKLSILSDIAAGMAYLHGSSPPVIHCDLKSSNILLSESMQAKVCDFGLTVIAHKHGSTAAQSDDSVLGSLLWSAPEIISNGMFSTKSDVYAFGIMLWETVTRALPYRDMNPVLVSANVAEKCLRPEVGPEFESVQPLRDLMEQCWDASPDARPEFAEILGSLGKAGESLRDLIVRMAIVFTDIQQSTELWEWNAQLMKEALYQHHDAMRAALRRNKGYEVKTQGDAFMITFQDTVDALRFCAEAQVSLANLGWNPRLLEFPTCRCIMNGDQVQFRGLRVRMGIHYGEPEVERPQARGDVSTSMTSGGHSSLRPSLGSTLVTDYIGPCIVLSSAAAQEVQQDRDALAQLGKLHRVGTVRLQGIAQSEEIFDFEVAGLERTFEGVSSVTASDLPQHVPEDVQDLYERFSQTTVPSWAIAAKDVETTKEVAERGNFGVVFKGVWRSQAVAVKKFFRQKVDTITMAEIEHQIKEIALLSDIRHPNVVLFSMDVKVSDFGMGAVKTANKISTLCGSIAWMAPEVLSSAAYTEASDVYSFGVVMNEILTGEVPFKDLNKVAVSRDVLQGKRPDIPKKLGAYTSQYVDLMCRCWDQQPSQRPTFKAISAALSAM
eukprot:m51a1_g6123 putative serine threonine kinase (2328) ;mRNA; r:161514-172572